MKCKFCQREITKNMDICEYCRNPVPKTNKKPLVIGLSAGIFLTILVVAVLVKLFILNDNFNLPVANERTIQEEKKEFVFIRENAVAKFEDKIILVNDSKFGNMHIYDLEGNETEYVEGSFDGGILTDGKTAYINDYGDLYCMNLESGEKELLRASGITWDAAGDGSYIFAFYDNKLYFSECDETYVSDDFVYADKDYMYDLETGECTEIDIGVAGNMSRQYGSEVYYLDEEYTEEEYRQTLCKTDLTNNSVSVVLERVTTFNIVGDYLCYAQRENEIVDTANYDNNKYRVARYNLKTGETEVLAENSAISDVSFTSYGYVYYDRDAENTICIKYYDGKEMKINGNGYSISNDAVIVERYYSEIVNTGGRTEYNGWLECVIIDNKNISDTFIVEVGAETCGVMAYLDGIAYCRDYDNYQEKVIFN